MDKDFGASDQTPMNDPVSGATEAAQESFVDDQDPENLD